jgi:pSer/pThr/pTyr-binding forkhead associated (FHA) protein
MKFHLVVSHGPHRGKAIPVKQSSFLIGRNAQCHLRPASPEVSDYHCTLITRNGKVFVRDLNSSRGTFVNQQKLEGERRLVHADQLKIGPLAFEVRIDSADTAAPVAADLQRDGDVLVTRSPERDADEAPAALSAEEAEEIAAAALLNDEAPSSPADNTGTIALASAETATVPAPTPRPAPAASSEAARAILNEYRRRRNSRPVGNQR